MNSYERVMARLRGENVDKIPNLNIIMAFAAAYIGCPYSVYATDYKKLVQGNIACCEAFGIDAVSCISDPLREASRYGAKVEFPYDDIPYCSENLIADYVDIAKVKIADPMYSERMLDRIRAVELYKKELESQYPIIGWVEGAFAESCDLRGVSQIMTDIFDNEDFVFELLEITAEQAIVFAREQIKAGADIVGIGEAAASLIGPNIYRRFALPYEKKISDAIHAAGAKVKLHICGDTSRMLPFMGETGADIIDIDYMVDYQTAVKTLRGISICGNLNPVWVILNASPDEVFAQTKRCVENGDNFSIIAGGCEIPKNTPFENMLAVNRACYFDSDADICYNQNV